MNEGDIIYHKLDGRKMVVVKIWNDRIPFQCRFVNGTGEYETGRFYECEVTAKASKKT